MGSINVKETVMLGIASHAKRNTWQNASVGKMMMLSIALRIHTVVNNSAEKFSTVVFINVKNYAIKVNANNVRRHPKK